MLGKNGTYVVKIKKIEEKKLIYFKKEMCIWLFRLCINMSRRKIYTNTSSFSSRNSRILLVFIMGFFLK